MSTPTAYDDTADTRGDAMRAYQKALDAKKMAASSALSIQRLREDLPSIEEKLAGGRRDEAIAEYKKALAIAPDLQESVQGLKALQRGKP